jgi:parvulin-like peptidyl-prolyl isomerase
MAALGERGALSEVFQTPFGFHVALLLERTPERKRSKAERLEGLKDEILVVRAKRAKRALLERLRADAGITLPTNVDAILARAASRAEEP